MSISNVRIIHRGLFKTVEAYWGLVGQYFCEGWKVERMGDTECIAYLGSETDFEEWKKQNNRKAE